MNKNTDEISLFSKFIPVLGLMIIIIVGIIIMPWLTATTNEITDLSGNIVTVTQPGESMPLGIVFIFASIISVINLVRLGFKWNDIQDAMVSKIVQLMPAAMIILCIGLVIGSWVYSGTIPMLIHYGIDLMNPKYIYLVAFIIPSIFSMLTGTSWGSAGTIGVVIMGIGVAVGANPAIVAGAVVGGSYFGDKMSPLSDTTNIAALATGVPIMDHIRSMMNTTGPAYILAAVTYLFIGMGQKGITSNANMEAAIQLKSELASVFQFSEFWQIILLAIPILVVLYGSITKKPTVIVLVASSILAVIIGIFVQQFPFNQALMSLNSGFNSTAVFGDSVELSANTLKLINRGGLSSITDTVIVSILIFLYIGSLNMINAIPELVNKAFGWAKTRPQVILASQATTALTNAFTSNQTATSYIIGEAFKPKYDEQKIPRKVLSRTIEDFGTMLENILPWTATGLYMFSVLGVSPIAYWKYQFISFYGFAIAIFLAITGIGCFYKEVDK